MTPTNIRRLGYMINQGSAPIYSMMDVCPDPKTWGRPEGVYEAHYEGVWTTLYYCPTVPPKECTFDTLLPWPKKILIQSVSVDPIGMCGHFAIVIGEKTYGKAPADHPVLTFCKGQEDVTEFGLLVPSCQSFHVAFSQDYFPVQQYTLSVTGLLLREIC